MITRTDVRAKLAENKLCRLRSGPRENAHDPRNQSRRASVTRHQNSTQKECPHPPTRAKNRRQPSFVSRKDKSGQTLLSAIAPPKYQQAEAKREQPLKTRRLHAAHVGERACEEPLRRTNRAEPAEETQESMKTATRVIRQELTNCNSARPSITNPEEIEQPRARHVR